MIKSVHCSFSSIVLINYFWFDVAAFNTFVLCIGDNNSTFLFAFGLHDTKVMFSVKMTTDVPLGLNFILALLEVAVSNSY